MKAPTYSFQIITPEGIAFTDEVVHARIPTTNGFVGVLAHHAAYVTASAGGLLTIREEKSEDEKVFSVGPGIFEVHKNHASFFTAQVRLTNGTSL